MENEQKDYYGYIYLTLDQKRNKVYVGQKKGRIEDSMSYYGSGLIIKQIINSRGTYFLKKFILGVCYSKEELTECETECKYFFNAFDRLYGYNIAINDLGGDTLTHNPRKEDIIKQIKISCKKIYFDYPELREQARLRALNRYKDEEYYNDWLVKNRSEEKTNKMLTTRKQNWDNLTEEEQNFKRLDKCILLKSTWNLKSKEEKQSFIDKMIFTMNKDSVVAKSKESRKRPEYKKLISDKLIEYCSSPEVRQQRSENAKNQWDKPGAKEEYSKNRIEWHSDPTNKKKHSDGVRKSSSFLVEDYVKNVAIYKDFTYYDIIDCCNTTYYITDYWIKKEIQKGNIVKGKNRGKEPTLYTRIR